MYVGDYECTNPDCEHLTPVTETAASHEQPGELHPQECEACGEPLDFEEEPQGPDEPDPDRFRE